MISGRVVALKYCFPGCSFVFLSLAYCSMDFKRYFLWPKASVRIKEVTCLFSQIHHVLGGILSRLVRIPNGAPLQRNIPEHFNDPGYLVVFARSGEQR
jgi:hypothetical protein